MYTRVPNRIPSHKLADRHTILKSATGVEDDIIILWSGLRASRNVFLTPGGGCTRSSSDDLQTVHITRIDRTLLCARVSDYNL